MGETLDNLRRRLAPVSLGIWPSLENPAWRSSGALRVFGDRLRLSVEPRRIRSKLKADVRWALRGAFMVDHLDLLPTEPVAALYTYRDMEDIARHGADWRATRLGQWLLAAIAAGRPPTVRGAVVTSDSEIEAYYRVYLTMFESMRAEGYRYEGDDHMCFGLGAAGDVILIRRGTHRLAAAQLLGVPEVQGFVTHIDRAFAERAVRDHPRRGVADAIVSAAKTAVAR
jgi:hypothetical protein